MKYQIWIYKKDKDYFGIGEPETNGQRYLWRTSLLDHRTYLQEEDLKDFINKGFELDPKEYWSS